MDSKTMIENTEYGMVSLSGTAKEIVAAFRGCKVARAGLKGKFSLSPTDRMGGLNIRKASFTDGKAMHRVFAPFTGTATPKFVRPCYDDLNKAVVATNGWAMLFCDIPEGFTRDDAAKGNLFCTDPVCDYPNWLNVLNGCSRENTPYALSDFAGVGEVGKGSGLHNLLALASACSRAYRHTDRNGCWHNVYLWIGGNQYDPVAIADLVDALYRLGSDRVGFYYPEFGYSYKPLHLVGFGDGINARGLLMPMRFPSAECGGIEIPFSEKAANAA